MRTRAALGFLAVALIAACGGTAKSTNTATNKTQGQSGSSTVSAAPSISVSGGTASIDKSFWYDGLKVTLADLTVVKPPKPSPGYTVAKTKLLINATFENLGADNSLPYNLGLVLQSGVNSYLDHDSEDEKIPEVPGLQRTKGVIAFFIDDKFSLDNAVMLVGNAANNQAQVPLGSTGKYISLEPQKVALSGTINMPGAFTLAIAGADLTYDNRKDHREEKAGEVRLTVHFAATGSRDASCCLSSENLVLKLPDGTAVASTRNSPAELPGKGLTIADESAEWVFKAADGAYDMIVKGKYGVDYAEQQADLPFNIALGVSASGSASPPVGGAYPSPSGAAVQPSPSGH